MAFRPTISSFSLALASALPATPIADRIVDDASLNSLNVHHATITPTQYVDNLRTFSQTKSSRPLRGPKPFFILAKRSQGYLRYLHTSPAGVGVVMW